MELLKVDSKTKEPLADVNFKVTCLDGFMKGQTWDLKSNDKGIVNLKSLEYGSYRIQEIKTVEGYVLNTKPIDFKIKENGKKIELKMANDRITGDMELLKVDSKNNSPLGNVNFKVTCLDGFMKGQTWDLKSNDKGIVNLKSLEYGSYRIQEIKTVEGYVLNTKPIDFKIKENGKKIELKMANDRITGDMKLLKLDSKTGEPLANVRFKITGITGFNKGKDFKLYSNDYGIVELRDLEYGSYRIDEIETANAGYVLNTNPMYFEIKENGDNVELKMTNDKIVGNMELQKIDADTKKPMPFVKFKVSAVDTFNMDQEYILESDFDGKIKLENLEAGVYRIDEIETVDGYILNKEPILFTIQNNGETVKLEMENRIKKGKVELIKVDEDTNRPLQGVKFELCKGDEVVGEYTTDENGKIVVDNLPWGNYYFVEIATDNNYILNQDEFYNFFVEEDGQVIQLTAKNKVKNGEVEFTKTDVSTGEIIEGAKIEIVGLDEHNKHIKIEFTSSKEGNKFKLPVGKYEFKETQAPEGYELSTEVGTFEIKDGEITKANLKNERTTGVLEFTKTDVATGEVLEGAHIKIECLEGLDQGKVIEFISRKEGNKFTLAKGKYRISETQAPNGYELTTETGEFEITEHGQIIKCNLTNKKFEIVKTGGAFDMNMMLPLGLILVAGSLGALAFTKRKRA